LFCLICSFRPTNGASEDIGLLVYSALKHYNSNHPVRTPPTRDVSGRPRRRANLSAKSNAVFQSLNHVLLISLIFSPGGCPSGPADCPSASIPPTHPPLLLHPVPAAYVRLRSILLPYNRVPSSGVLPSVRLHALVLGRISGTTSTSRLAAGRTTMTSGPSSPSYATTTLPIY
jgi:hypothetical protein